MGAGIATCSTATSCSGCASLSLQADGTLAQLYASRTAANLDTIDGNVRYPPSGVEGTKAESARVRLNNAVREFGVKGRPEDADAAKRKAQDRLFMACREGNFKRTVDAITSGADVHSRTLRGQTPLMLAAAASSRTALDTIRFLVEALSDLEAKDQEGWTALLHACRNNEAEAVALLLEKKASIKARAADGKTAVMLATMDGGDGLVMDLIQKQASISKQDDLGWSLLFYAADAGRHDLVKWLLRQQASAKEKAKDGTTALMLVGQGGHVRIAERLFKRSANINAENSTGNTALMLSLKAQKEAFAEWLLEEGADVGPRNNMKEDAMDIAEALGLNALRGRLEQRLRAQHDDYA